MVKISELYKNIKKRREFLGMSQGDLADKLGYSSRSTIAKIESGENDIPQSKIKAFAEALQTTPSELMGYSNNIEDDNDPKIIRIQRAYKKMPQKDKEKMMQILELSFDRYFADDYKDDDDDDE